MTESASQLTSPRSGKAQPSWLTIAGWCGTLAILGAYLGNSFAWIDRGVVYQLLNLGGALALAIVCWDRRAWQPLALEVVWAVIAGIALVRLGLGF